MKLPDSKKDAEIEIEIDVDAVADTANEIELESKTEERLGQVFSGEGLKAEPAEEPEESEDTIPESKEEKPEEESEEKDETTPEPEDDAEEKDKDAEPEAKDEDIDKSEKEVPQLSDAYYRAAIHRGMKGDEIDDFYKANPELCVKTLGNIYEAVKRSNEEFASFGRAHKEYKAQEAAAKATPPVSKQTASEVTVPEYKGVDFAALERTDIDPEAIAIIKVMDQQNKIMFDQMQQTRPVQQVEQPSGISAQQSRAETQETAAIQQQIENFFKADEIKLYEDFYGSVPKEDINWDILSPGQKANRWAVIEMMDDILTGARINNRDMKIDEAMRLAHLNVSESQREKVIREKLKATVAKRGKSLTLKPSSTNKSTEKVSPRTAEELEETTADRLRKVFGQ